MDCVNDIMEIFNKIRLMAIEHFAKVMTWIRDTITPLHIKLQMPRQCARQTHRDNPDIVGAEGVPTQLLLITESPFTYRF